VVSIMLSVTGDFEASQATQARHLRWGVFALQRPVSLGGKRDVVRCEEPSLIRSRTRSRNKFGMTVLGDYENVTSRHSELDSESRCSLLECQ